jgi:ubiquinone/menaquinone biosynthesis C-methylase UbiE
MKNSEFMPGPSRHQVTRDSRREELRQWADSIAPERDRWTKRNKYYYADDMRYMQFLVPKGVAVLELGCGTGSLLNQLRPSVGVGVDLSDRAVEIAKRRFPKLTFVRGDLEDEAVLKALERTFDIVILSDVIGYLEDCQIAFRRLHSVCHSDTRIVVSYFAQGWRPFLKLAEKLKLKMPQPNQNWLSSRDVEYLLDLEGFETVRRERRLLVPRRLFGLGPLVNKTLGTLPGIRRLSLRHYVVARPVSSRENLELSTTVVIPCRNEAGNIDAAVQRLPHFCRDQEIIFVEGHSSDNTRTEIEEVIRKYPDRDIKLLVQDGRGKADAVRKGFDAARGDILMILDADLTVAPEDLGKFYDVIASGRADYVHGTRLIYPLDPGAMRTLNFFANHAFAGLFTWLLNQRVTDTLCGTKVLTADSYGVLAANRDYFGDFDPFGDFDLIFGASKLNMKMVEIPVRYTSRTYGETQISRFSDGFLLLKMVAFAFRKLKAV